VRAYGRDRVPNEGDRWVNELGHGWFNVAYELRLRDGSRVVLKIAPPPRVEVMTYERGAMETELAALRLITGQTDVPVPPLDFADESRELCDAHYFFMPFIEADNLGLITAEVAAYHEALGAANCELNSIPGTAFGSAGTTTSSAPRSRSMQGHCARSSSRGSSSGTSGTATCWSATAGAGTVDRGNGAARRARTVLLRYRGRSS